MVEQGTPNALAVVRFHHVSPNKVLDISLCGEYNMKTYKRRTVLTMQRMLQGDCEHRVVVTRIGDGYNIRVFTNGHLNQEARVYDKQHIQPEAKSMLRFEDKCGNISKYAHSARVRNKPYM